MNFRSVFAPAVPLVLAIASLPAADGRPAREEPKRAPGAKFLFIQLTDPQFGYIDVNKSVAPEVKLLTKAVDHVIRLRPAFVVITGDLVHKPGDATQARACLDILARIPRSIPVHFVAGNHDLGDHPTPQSIAWFRKTFGPDHDSFAVDGWRFLVIDSTVLLHPDACREECAGQKAWFLERLRTKDPKAPRTIVFQHHPWFTASPDESDETMGLPRSLRKEFLDPMKAGGVRAVFAGHTHRGYRSRDGDLEMVVTSATGKPLGKDPSGLRIVWVFEDRFEDRYFGLDDVPEKVSMAGPPAAASKPEPAVRAAKTAKTAKREKQASASP